MIGAGATARTTAVGEVFSGTMTPRSACPGVRSTSGTAPDGPEPQATIDGLRMAAKKMYFESVRAENELGYAARPGRTAIEDALAWFRLRGMVP